MKPLATSLEAASLGTALSANIFTFLCNDAIWRELGSLSENVQTSSFCIETKVDSQIELIAWALLLAIS